MAALTSPKVERKRTMRSKSFAMTTINPATHHTLSRNEVLSLRMLGETIELRRYQWCQLVEELREDSELRSRIVALLGE